MPVGRVVNGTATAPYEHPYVFALMQTGSRRTSTQLCAATRVSARWLVTAAHCVSTSSIAHVRYLEHNLSQYDVCSRDAVAFVRPHPQWTGDVAQHDLALLRLRDPIQSHCDVHPEPYARLPMQHTLGESATVVGWGFGSNTAGDQLLHRATLAIMPKDECKRVWGRDMSCHLCAGNEAADACFGDSGGPLLSPQNTIAGVVSYGSGQSCASSTYPTVFVDLACYAEWIESYIASESMQEEACMCTEEGVSDGVLVQQKGCASHIGIEPWCYVSGGLQCLVAHPSDLYPSAAWIECGTTDGPGLSPPLSHTVVTVTFLFVFMLATWVATWARR